MVKDQLIMVKDRRWQIYPKCHSNRKLTTMLIYQNLGGPPPGSGMPFLDSDTCAEPWGYLFLSGFFSLYDAIHGWMTGWMDDGMDGWMEKTSRKTTTTSFTICNGMNLVFVFWDVYKYNTNITLFFIAPS
jgi:hypothetical protein